MDRLTPNAGAVVTNAIFRLPEGLTLSQSVTTRTLIRQASLSIGMEALELNGSHMNRWTRAWIGMHQVGFQEITRNRYST